MEAYIGVIWLSGAVAATFLGYDRGRLLAGILLGIGLGPAGAVAAGMMMPSLAVATRRTRAIQRGIARLHREERIAARQARHGQRNLSSWATAIERQAEDLEDYHPLIDLRAGGEFHDEDDSRAENVA